MRLRRRGRPGTGEERGASAALFANSGALFASRVIVAGLGWAGTLVVIRHLSVSEWGRFSFVFSLLGMLVVITTLVNNRLAIHGLLHSDDPAGYAGTYVLLRGALGLLGYAAAVTFVVVAGYPSDVIRATAIAGTLVVIASTSAGYDAVFQARMRLGPVATAGALGQVVQLGLILVVAAVSPSLVAFTLPAVACEVVIIAWKLRSVRPLVRPRYVVIWPTWVALFKATVPLAIGSGIAKLYYSIDAVMLSRMDTFRSVGIYGVAYKFAGLFAFIPDALMPPLFALLTRAWPGDPEQFRAVFRKAFLVLVLVAVFVVAEFLVFAEPAIRLLYGDQYAVGAGAARLVVTSECVGFFTALGLTTLVALDRNRIYPLVALLGLVVNVGLNLLVIPTYSYRGAAWATLITEVLVVAGMWGALARGGGVPRLPVARAAGAVAAGVAAALVAVAAWQVIPWPAAAVAGAVTYVAILEALRVPGPEGLRSLLRDEGAGAELPER